MVTVFRVSAAELDKKFLDVLKSLFGKRRVEITVADVTDDETDFLLRDPENRSHLLDAIKEVKENKNLVRFSGKEFEQYNKKIHSRNLKP